MIQTPLCLIQKQDCGAALSCSHTDHKDGWTASLKEIISIQNKREMGERKIEKDKIWPTMVKNDGNLV